MSSFQAAVVSRSGEWRISEPGSEESGTRDQEAARVKPIRIGGDSWRETVPGAGFTRWRAQPAAPPRISPAKATMANHRRAAERWGTLRTGWEHTGARAIGKGVPGRQGWPGPPYSGVLVAFHKPWGVLSQFTSDGSPHRTLAEFGFPAGIYPIGRLDADSEGLLLLSDEPVWTGRLLDPRQRHPRRYWVQVEGVPSGESLAALSRGVLVQGRRTLPCRVWILDPRPEWPPREPPIRVRKSVPDAWLALELVEGRNRQVRRMTAAVGHPTLRLIRVQIGGLELGGLAPGAWRLLGARDLEAVRHRPDRGTTAR